VPLIIETDNCDPIPDSSLNHPIAMAMYNTGTSHIKTQRDADELYIRYRMMHLAMNTLSTARILTYAEISSFVGATTNVSRKTQTQWNKQIGEVTRDSAITIMNRHKKEEVNA